MLRVVRILDFVFSFCIEWCEKIIQDKQINKNSMLVCFPLAYKRFFWSVCTFPIMADHYRGHGWPCASLFITSETFGNSWGIFCVFLLFKQFGGFYSDGINKGVLFLPLSLYLYFDAPCSYTHRRADTGHLDVFHDTAESLQFSFVRPK